MLVFDWKIIIWKKANYGESIPSSVAAESTLGVAKAKVGI